MAGGAAGKMFGFPTFWAGPRLFECVIGVGLTVPEAVVRRQGEPRGALRRSSRQDRISGRPGIPGVELGAMRRIWTLACVLLVAAGCATGRTAGAAPVGPPAVARGAPDPRNVYAATTEDVLGPQVAGVPERVYVPDSGAAMLEVIDPHTYRVIARYRVGRVPHHVTPSWDLRHLYVDNTWSNTLTEIDPRTSAPVATIPVDDPYNLYFTPDGTKAIVVAERDRRLDFRDPHTWHLIASVRVPRDGVDHLDFSADGQSLVASAEFSGHVVKVDTETMTVTGDLDVGGRPVDVRLAPDGSVFYVANQGRGGVSIVDPEAMREIAFLPTGHGAHGLCLSRDARWLYVSNRLSGTISVIDLAERAVRETWRVGGSPDMEQASPDGTQLWVSNRFHATVSVIDTRTGQVLHTIRVGRGAHGLAYFPQPGRYSLGHNGVYR